MYSYNGVISDHKVVLYLIITCYKILYITSYSGLSKGYRGMGNSTQLCCDFGGCKTLQLVVRLQSSSLRLHGGEGFCLPHRGLSGGCMSLGRLSAPGKHILAGTARQHDEGEERRFPARFSLWNINRCNKNLQCCILCLIVPIFDSQTLSKKSFVFSGSRQHTIMAFARSIISLQIEKSAPLIISRKVASSAEL